MATFPVQGYTAAVEPHWGSNRGGADLFAPRGTPVVAPLAGTVVDATESALGGLNLTLRSADGLLFYLAHLQSIAVRAGQQVTEGQSLGTVGDTGNARNTGPHLHIGIGRAIVSGSGPAGGTGAGFDAVSWLNQALRGVSAPIGGLPGVPGMPEPGKPAGPAPLAPVAPTPIAIPNPLAGFADSLGGVAASIGALPGAIAAPFITAINTAYTTLAWLGQPNIWLRIGLVILGAVVILIGLVLFGVSLVPKEVVQAAAKAV